MSNKGRHYFYQGFDIHVRWLNPEPVPGYGIELGWRFEIWSPKVTGHRRKKVHSLSEAYSSRVIAAVIAQSVIDKIISTQARAVQVPDTLQ
ncbi:hypothetical protein [Microcoleus sp. OTE_8_concoct_300]|jgi:hypothetical protein|uniref:hypothetical protein n=1 Tax=Microcoleus sp. OTE_8_concoct_300 TaxID=2964710 RepID=UPI00403FBFB6